MLYSARQRNRAVCYFVAAMCWAGFAMPWYRNRPTAGMEINERIAIGLWFDPWFEQTTQATHREIMVRTGTHPDSWSSVAFLTSCVSFVLGHWVLRPPVVSRYMTRRQLSFAAFEDVLADMDRLRLNGYRKVGQWDLSQVCGHLAAWLTYPVSGFPKAPLPVRLMLGVIRTLRGRAMLKKFLREGMPAGQPTIPQSVVPAGGDEAAAVEGLRAAVRRFEAHAGEYLPSPLFGPLTRDEAAQVQLRHAAHHLSFLIPN